MNNLEVNDTDARPEVAASSAKGLDGHNSGVTAGFVAWMCFLTFVGTLLVAYFGLKLASQQSPGLLGGGQKQEIVFVDHEKLYVLKVKEIANGKNVDPERAKAEAGQFAAEIDKAVKRMTDEGKLVMTSQVLFGQAGKADVTDQVAKTMGLNP